MAEHVLLDLEAPLMSFGGVSVDATNPTDAFPSRSMLAGLLGNALGWTHEQVDELQELQDDLVIASRADRPGTWLEDYQTVGVGQEHLVDTGWTWWGVPQRRRGGSSKGTHIRRRAYLADARVLVALGRRAYVGPSQLDLAEALRRPRRPLYLGRKACVPSRELLLDIVEADSPREALLGIPWLAADHPTGARAERPRTLDMWSDAPPNADPASGDEVLIVYDRRDWRNQIHTGRHLIRRETIPLEALPEGGRHG
jgi:CRISPR system Cascade subunit CasD